MVLRVSPVSTLTAVTLTPATTAPVGSVTVPRIVAVVPVCASSGVTAKAASKVSLTIFGKYTPARAPRCAQRDSVRSAGLRYGENARQIITPIGRSPQDPFPTERI